MAAPFSVSIPVRFADCDPAGIVFYPRYFEMFNALVEDWCAQGLGMPFREMHVTQRIGLPTVRLETDFVAPSELGETLRAELAVRRIGGASLQVALRLLGADGGERVRAKVVLVAMDLDARCAVPLPRALRERAAAYVVDDAADAADAAGDAARTD